MNLLADLFPSAWLVVAGVGQLLVWAWCVRTAPGRASNRRR